MSFGQIHAWFGKIRVPEQKRGLAQEHFETLDECTVSSDECTTGFESDPSQWCEMDFSCIFLMIPRRWDPYFVVSLLYGPLKVAI